MKNKALQYVQASPKRLFLLDAAGAMLSAFLLGVVLVAHQPTFGIPVPTLYLLAVLPCFFVVYDGLAYFTSHASTSKKLKGIAVLNTVYCALSLALIVHHWQHITALGWAYLGVEIMIVLFIANLERETANSLKST